MAVNQDFAYTNIRTSVLDKKKAALVALGSLAEHAPRAFYPHLPLAMETLTNQVCVKADKQVMMHNAVILITNCLISLLFQRKAMAGRAERFVVGLSMWCRSRERGGVLLVYSPPPPPGEKLAWVSHESGCDCMCMEARLVLRDVLEHTTTTVLGLGKK